MSRCVADGVNPRITLGHQFDDGGRREWGRMRDGDDVAVTR